MNDTLAELQGLVDARGVRYASPSFLRPFHLLTFAITVKRKGFTHLTMEPRLTSYANRMGFWQAAGLLAPTTVSGRSPKGRFCPLTSLDNQRTVGQAADQLTSLFRASAVDEDTQASLETAVVEILENCYKHAPPPQSSLFALAAAQAWFKGNLAQIAVADAGVGIRARLKQNAEYHQLLRTANACELATRYGVTGDPAGGHSGYGLTLAKDLLVKNSGNLIVVSKHEMVVCNRKGVFPYKTAAPWDGTLVIFEWRTNRRLDARSVYRSWPTPQGFDDDDLM